MTSTRLLDIFEDSNLKQKIINSVKKTDNVELLQKIFNTLTAGDLPDRLHKVLSKDKDAAKFINSLSKVIMHMDHPNSEKLAFLDNYSAGFIDSKKLLDGNQHSYKDFVQAGLPLDLFVILVTELTSLGVGPGEVALAVLSPEIRWSGRAGSGGDVQVNEIAVEVKTKVSGGGRWINTRKANMNMSGIKKAIEDAWTQSKNAEPIEIPSRISITNWVYNIRPKIDSTILKSLAKTMADGLFNQVDNSLYVQELIAGDPAAIKNAILTVGFNNYKKYSDFDGILLIDHPAQVAQYFKTYESMQNSAKAESAYVYAPESEAMPKVSLIPDQTVAASTINSRPGNQIRPPEPILAPAVVTGKRQAIRPPGTAIAEPRSNRNISSQRQRR